jgi:hypothetical protein
VIEKSYPLGHGPYRTPPRNVTDSATQGREQALATTGSWLSDFICQPNEDVGRPGPVCPFVGPSLQAGTLRVEVMSGYSKADAPIIHALISDMVTMFRETKWQHSNPTMHALLFVLPDLPQQSWSLLDECQFAVKPTLAEQGLMLGQFHPECTEPAARNNDFLVARSPIPMLALRNMAFHDILFLRHDARCFNAYDQRFGPAYERHSNIPELFRQTYAEAKDGFASSGNGTL